jgi:putative selenium metabolism hydrolase
MRELDYDQVRVDDLGNVIGAIGGGPTSILFDSHMDTVAVTNPDEWSFDPFSGDVKNGMLQGRGSVDMKGALAASVYAGHIIKRLGLHEDKTIYLSATVMEEDYDGEAVYAMCREMEPMPDFAVICEPSNLELALGHKGRALIRVTAQGVSAHGSAPEKGVNAVYKLGPLLERVEALGKRLMQQQGPAGSIALTCIKSIAESLNAIPGRCEAYLDRRMVMGEDLAVISREMDSLLEGLEAQWEIYDKRGGSYTGLPVVLHSFLPPWEIGPDSPLALACVKAYEVLMNREPGLSKWDFSTNGVATAGRLSIPSIGFGPGDSKKAHMVDESCEISQIKAAAAFYALLPHYL